LEVDEYGGVREDFVHYFEGVETFCVGVERYSTGGGNKENFVSNKVHLHVFLRFYEKVYLSEVREVLESFCFGTINVQSCRSRRNWLKYITKEEDSPYFNCKVSELSFRYRCLFWAKGAERFRITNPFVVGYSNKWRYLEEFYREVNGVKRGVWTGYKRTWKFRGGWWGSVAGWYNRFVQNGFDVCRQKQLYLYGSLGVGNTTCTESLLPYKWEFFCSDLDDEYKYAVCEEMCWDKFKENIWQIKRLLEFKPFPVDVKCKSRGVANWRELVIFVSNDDVICNDAIIDRLEIIRAYGLVDEEDEVDFEKKVQTAANEVVEAVEVIPISSDEED
jgi:hypothetical protein